jgi:hypothetical protein
MHSLAYSSRLWVLCNPVGCEVDPFVKAYTTPRAISNVFMTQGTRVIEAPTGMTWTGVSIETVHCRYSLDLEVVTIVMGYAWRRDITEAAHGVLVDASCKAVKASVGCVKYPYSPTGYILISK